jgi:hypothetical protein
MQHTSGGRSCSIPLEVSHAAVSAWARWMGAARMLGAELVVMHSASVSSAEHVMHSASVSSAEHVMPVQDVEMMLTWLSLATLASTSVLAGLLSLLCSARGHHTGRASLHGQPRRSLLLLLLLLLPAALHPVHLVVRQLQLAGRWGRSSG